MYVEWTPWTRARDLDAFEDVDLDAFENAGDGGVSECVGDGVGDGAGEDGDGAGEDGEGKAKEGAADSLLTCGEMKLIDGECNEPLDNRRIDPVGEADGDRLRLP